MPPGSLRDLVGQRRAVDTLVRALGAGRLHHAYLFEGPHGVGKGTTARALAAAINCEARDPYGCGACGSCVKVAADLHPDVIHFDMTPKGLTERVRELTTLGGFRPHEGRARVVVFDPAEALGGPQDRAEPANVLLKTLEEPAADTYLLLVTAEPRRLPVTVRSRCQTVRFSPLSKEAIAGWLVTARGVAPALADEAADGAEGSLGRALGELDAAEAGERVRVLAAALVTASKAGDHPALFEAAGEPDRQLAEEVCGYLQRTLHDALVGGVAGGAAALSPQRAERARALWGEISSATALAALRHTDECLTALKGNVAPALALEHLALGTAGLL